MTGVITWVVDCGDGVCIERSQAMRTFFLLLASAVVTGFGFGVTATSSDQKAVDRIVESHAAQYCEKGFTEFCS